MIKVKLIESIGNDEELINDEFNKLVMFTTNLKKNENLIKYLSLGMDNARLKFLIEAPINVAFELSKYQTGLVWNDVDIDSPKWYWSGTLFGFTRFCNVRNKKTINCEVTNEIRKNLKERFPKTTQYVLD